MSTPEIKHINLSGEFVEETDVTAAFAVNLSDPAAEEFIAAVKVRAGLASQIESQPVSVSRRKASKAESAKKDSPKPETSEE